MTAKPRVNTKCVADHYSAPDEKIIEFSDRNNNGGLISFWTREDGKLMVSIYRTDKDVIVTYTPERSSAP